MTKLFELFAGLPPVAQIAISAGLFVFTAAVCFLVCYFPISKLKSDHEDGKKTNRKVLWHAIIGGILALLLAASTVISTIWTIQSSLRLSAANDEKQSSASESDTSDGDGDEGEDGDKLDDDAFVVDFSDDDVRAWMRETFGEDFDPARIEYCQEGFPSNTRKRIEAVSIALEKYLPKSDVKAFEDAVLFPKTGLLEVFYGDTKEKNFWGNLSDSEKEEFINETMRINLYMDILSSSYYADMFVQAISEEEALYERNELLWLGEFKDQLDAAYATKEKPRGNSAFATKAKDTLTGKLIEDKIFCKEDFVFNAARVCILLDYFSIDASNPIIDERSVSNWHFVPTADADAVRTVKLSGKDEQENLPAIRLVHRFKISGNVAYLWGVNLFDGRLEKFDPNTTKPTPTFVGNPTPSNPTPVKYNPTPSNPTPSNPTPTKLKDPSKDPVNQGNAPIGGGPNKPGDGSGELTSEPTVTNYPKKEETSNNKVDITDTKEDGSTTGTGGETDPNVTGSGGTTQGSTPPATNPNPPQTTTGNGGTTDVKNNTVGAGETVEDMMSD